MKTIRYVLFCASLVPLQAGACELADLVFLNADTDVQYAFVQNKTVAVLPRPLTSSGVLGLSSNDELVWQTRVPLQSTMVIAASGIRQFDRNDIPVNAPANQTADALAQVFLNLLSGDTDMLVSSFTPALTCENNSWRLELEPATDALARLLSGITITGSARLETIAFTEQRGDHTEISISPLSATQSIDFGRYLGD